MGWIIAALLALVVVVLTALYRKALNEERNLTNYALLILLDESAWKAQRRGLHEMVRSLDVSNAGQLGAQVNLATSQLAARLSGTILGVAGMLWKLKQQPLPDAAKSPSIGAKPL
jgi:hypothetical protein